MNDIDCTSMSTTGMPIGNPFIGTFNGQGHTISNVNYNGGCLFGTNSGNISNLNIVNAVITSSGGILACTNTGIITNCSSSGSISGSTRVGGLVGKNSGGTIQKSYSSASVSGSNSVGGLVGYAVGASDSIDGAYNIDNCYATGNVSSSLSNVGGLVGLSDAEDGLITNSYSTGFVNTVSGAGGLVGRALGSSTTNSFWDTETSGQITSVGGTGKTTAEMKTITTFSDAGWDIFTTNNNQNNGYPFLSGSSWLIYEEAQIPATQGVRDRESSDVLTGAVTQEPVVKLTIWQMLSNWFQKIINWFKGVFHIK